MKKNKLIKRIKLTLLYLISIFFGFYLTEYYFFNKDKKILNTMSKYNFYKESLKENYNSIYAINPFHNLDAVAISNYLPLSGVSNHHTITCNENGYFGKYLSDIHGFNNQNEIWNEKNISYLLIGDSFGLGSCVLNNESIQHNIKQFTNSTVLNLSLGGNGPLLEYAILREYLEFVNTKKVIWLFYEGNDLTDLERENRSPLLKKYLDDDLFSQNLYNLQNKNDAILLEYFEKNKKKLGFKLIKDFLKLKRLRENIDFNKIKKKDNIAIPENFLEIILAAKKLSNDNSADFYFVYLPTYNRFLEKKEIYPYKELSNLIKLNGINFINLQNIYFSKIKYPLDSFPNRKRGHYTAKTYKEISAIIIKEIEKLKNN